MKTVIQQFIEDAIEGGWYKNFFKKGATWSFDGRFFYISTGTTNVVELTFAEILLDPSAWQAVGKVRGWEDVTFYRSHPDFNENEIVESQVSGHLWNMHRMIDALAENTSIENYLKTLE